MNRIRIFLRFWENSCIPFLNHKGKYNNICNQSQLKATTPRLKPFTNLKAISVKHCNLYTKYNPETFPLFLIKQNQTTILSSFLYPINPVKAYKQTNNKHLKSVPSNLCLIPTWKKPYCGSPPVMVVSSMSFGRGHRYSLREPWEVGADLLK